MCIKKTCHICQDPFFKKKKKIVGHVPLCFLFYFDNCLVFSHFIVFCQVSLLCDSCPALKCLVVSPVSEYLSSCLLLFCCQFFCSSPRSHVHVPVLLVLLFILVLLNWLFVSVLYFFSSYSFSWSFSYSVHILNSAFYSFKVAFSQLHLCLCLLLVNPDSACQFICLCS